MLGVLLRPAEHVLSPAEETLFERALLLHHDALVVDAHDDVLTYIVDYQYDLAMVSGKYFDNQKMVKSSNVSYDLTVAGQLWQVSKDLTE